MVELLILGDGTKADSPKYRGVDRSTPYYVDGLHDDAPVNQAFLRYVEDSGQSGIIHDLDFAKELVKLYASLSPPQHFEIIEATMMNHPPKCGREFLGFDLSAGYHYSLLSWGLEIDRPSISGMHSDAELLSIEPLLKLVKSTFQSMLNDNGLFESTESSIYCLECLIALQNCRPQLFEDPSVVFQVVGLWRVGQE